jgi:iron complex outermembrane receptor protein
MSGELRFGGREDFVAFNFSADDQKSRLPGTRTEAQLSSDPRGATTPNDFMNSRSELFSLRGEKRFGEVTLALDLSQRNKTFDSFGTGTYTLFGIQTYTSRMGTDMDVTTVSPRMLWKAQLAGMDNRLTVGADWSDWTYTNHANNTDTLFGNSVTRTVGNQDNRAIYFRDELAVTSGTQLSFGARRENVGQDQKEYLTPLPKASVEHHLSAYELALQQDLGAGFSAYGRLSRSFRVATIDENRCLFAPCGPLLKPQRSHDRELGIQLGSKGGKGASFRAGLFEMDVDDEIHYNALTFTNMNLSPTRHRGLELEGKLFISEQVDLAARYTWIEATFREGTYGGVDVTDNAVPLVPKDRIGLNLGWQATAATRLTFNVNYVGSQRYDNDQANRFREMPSYSVADIKVSHDQGAWRLAAGVNNLFDEAYYSYGVINGAATTFNAYPEDRRNAYVSAEYRF